jgi:hypothetical protein
MEAALGGADRDVESLGDLVVAPIEQVAENDQ